MSNPVACAPTPGADLTKFVWGLPWPMAAETGMKGDYWGTRHPQPNSHYQGICSTLSVTLYITRKKNKLCIKCMALSSLLLPELTIATVAALSRLHLTDFPCHCLSHNATANTTGRSSWMVMCTQAISTNWATPNEMNHQSMSIPCSPMYLRH